jgi:hypothetical protein
VEAAPIRVPSIDERRAIATLDVEVAHELLAFFSMNSRRGSTSSPASVWKI